MKRSHTWKRFQKSCYKTQVCLGFWGEGPCSQGSLGGWAPVSRFSAMEVVQSGSLVWARGHGQSQQCNLQLDRLAIQSSESGSFILPLSLQTCESLKGGREAGAALAGRERCVWMSQKMWVRSPRADQTGLRFSVKAQQKAGGDPLDNTGWRANLAAAAPVSPLNSELSQIMIMCL